MVLAATPAGKQLYNSLGFVEQYTLSRWAGRAATARPGPLPTGMSEWHESDSVHVEGLDTEAFGVSRSAMRDALAADSISKLVLNVRGRLATPGSSADAIWSGRPGGGLRN